MHKYEDANENFGLAMRRDKIDKLSNECRNEKMLHTMSFDKKHDSIAGSILD